MRVWEVGVKGMGSKGRFIMRRCSLYVRGEMKGGDGRGVRGDGRKNGKEGVWGISGKDV